MFADRRVYAFDLVTATPLHVGKGETLALSRPPSNEPMQVGALMRDVDGKPYLPATTLKGVLRRLAEDAGMAEDPGFIPLFGAIKDSNEITEKGSMGLLLMRAGRWKGGVPDCSGMPYASLIETGDAFVAARTAIDAATGVADDHKLYFQEMLPAKSRFGAEAIVLRHGEKSAVALALMDRLLALAMRDGLFVGKGRADGQGQLSFGSVTIVDWTLDASGDLKGGAQRNLAKATPETQGAANVVARQTWRLVCDAPFLVADSSVGLARDSRDPHRDKKASGPQIRAQSAVGGLPLVLGSSISGALRARAEWLADRAERRDGLAGARAAVEELFGRIEWRALAEIRNLKVEKAEPFDITSLRIDRFTGGPVDGALFTTAAFIGVEIAFDIVLARRSGKDGFFPGEAATGLFDLLCKDVVANGLMLGAGVNKGFGWFTLREASHGA